MSDMAQSRLILLWEHEVRIAARLLVKAFDAQTKDDKSPEEELAAGVLMVDAFNACLAALHGADDEEATLVLSAVPDVVKARRKKEDGGFS